MKIEEGTVHVGAPQGGVRKKAAGVETKEKSAIGADESAYNVELSSVAGQTVSGGDEEEARRAKVAAIRDQLAAGSYNISGKDVASKILGALKG